MRQSSITLCSQDLHKEYTKGKVESCECKESDEPTVKVAVKSLSFAVDESDVLGLLGHNGAGKTTTMKIITAEEAPTRGKVSIKPLHNFQGPYRGKSNHCKM